MIDHRLAQVALGPPNGVGIGTLAGQEQRAEAREIVVPQVHGIGILALDRPEGGGRGEQGDDAGYVESYLAPFPGYYTTADAGYIDEDGYIYVMGRTDDIINVAGHRLSTGGLEEVLAAHPAVAECAVIGAADALQGQVPVGFVVLKAGIETDHDEITAELVAMVRERIGPIATPKLVTVVARLPKTRSGKVLRGTMRKIADGEPYTVPATVDDPAILEEIAAALGFASRPP